MSTQVLRPVIGTKSSLRLTPSTSLYDSPTITSPRFSAACLSPAPAPSSHHTTLLPELDMATWLTTVKGMPMWRWAGPIALIVGSPPLDRISSASKALYALVDIHVGPYSRELIAGELILSAPLRDTINVKGKVSREDVKYLVWKIREFRDQAKAPGWSVDNQRELDRACMSAIAALEARMVIVGDGNEEGEVRGRRSTLSRLWSKSSEDDWSEAWRVWIRVLRWATIE